MTNSYEIDNEVDVIEEMENFAYHELNRIEKVKAMNNKTSFNKGDIVVIRGDFETGKGVIRQIEEGDSGLDAEIDFDDGHSRWHSVSTLILFKEERKPKNMTTEDVIIDRMIKYQKNSFRNMRKSYKQEVPGLKANIEQHEKELKNYKEQIKEKELFLNSKHKAMNPKNLKMLIRTIKKYDNVEDVKLVNCPTVLFRKQEDYITANPHMLIYLKPIVCTRNIEHIDYQIDSNNHIMRDEIGMPIEKSRKTITDSSNFGEYVISIDFDSYMATKDRIRIFNKLELDIQTKCNTSLSLEQHPHIQSMGECCFGEFGNMLVNEMRTLNIDNLIIGTVHYLSACNDSSAYCHFWEFVNRYKFLSQFKTSMKFKEYDLFKNQVVFLDIMNMLRTMEYKEREYTLEEINKNAYEKVKEMMKFNEEQDRKRKEQERRNRLNYR